MRAYKPDPRHEEAFKLHQQGLSKSEIARKFSVSGSTVGWWINKFEHNKNREPEYAEWAESLSTRSFLTLRYELGDEVMKMSREDARKEIMQVDMLKFPNFGRKSAKEVMDALGAEISFPEMDFSESHAKACISYLEKWGYKVTPPDK